MLLAFLPTILLAQNSWVNVQLLTDSYADETSWTITPPGGSPIIAQNDTPLADLVAKFEEGSKLLKDCQAQLTEAEIKIKQHNIKNSKIEPLNELEEE